MGERAKERSHRSAFGRVKVVVSTIFEDTHHSHTERQSLHAESPKFKHKHFPLKGFQIGGLGSISPCYQ